LQPDLREVMPLLLADWDIKVVSRGPWGESLLQNGGGMVMGARAI
jgi:hypothetical protein